VDVVIDETDVRGRHAALGEGIDDDLGERLGVRRLRRRLQGGVQDEGAHGVAPTRARPSQPGPGALGKDAHPGSEAKENDMSTAEQSRAIALAMFSCMAEQDYERMWSEFLTDDSTWTLIMQGSEPLRGRGIADFFAGGDAVFEGGAPTVTLTGSTAEGDRVAIEGVGKGRLRNGREYDNRYHFLVEVRDGRVAAVREYMDSQHVATVMAP
jgi:ketosteroid isomerase-like protein